MLTTSLCWPLQIGPFQFLLVCENYAAEYDIMFNVDKSKLLFFKSILYDAIRDYGQWSDSWSL